MPDRYRTRTHPSQLQVECATCHATLYVPPSTLAQAKHLFCDQHCRTIWLRTQPPAFGGIPSGPAHYRWRGGFQGHIERARQAQDEHGCWLWQGAIHRDGYGYYNYRDSITRKGKSAKAHRAAYEYFVGPIPPGHDLDHVRERGCRSRRCINPAHLEPVTRAENLRRARAAKQRNAA